MQTETEPRIGQALLVPCFPYQTKVYNLDDDDTRTETVVGYWVRLRDKRPVAGASIQLDDDRWLVIGPAYERGGK